ncbi:acetyltransferase [Flavobacterium columnare]|uniref:Acetyltransferase n=1 Tax=Flavobacterium columnare TaxID=996 RepID=A0A437U8H8_9FLAO|nr:acetyltransferase [Flavobacterium columnare]RVU89926.1 acetyltransferase [Flavobacterium columnare]
MLIVGAKGFAKEVLEILHQNNSLENVVFFDNVNPEIKGNLYGIYPILKSFNAAKDFFETQTNKFTIGIGNPILRKNLYEKFTELGGEFTSTISSKSIIGNFGNTIEEGCNIMSGTVITNDVTIKKGGLINLNCTIGHDCIIQEYVEICPGVNISGNCNIGSYTFIGTNSTILPKITIGKNVIVAAGSVVTKDIPDNCMVAGIPAVIKKEILPLEF